MNADPGKIGFGLWARATEALPTRGAGSRVVAAFTNGEAAGIAPQEKPPEAVAKIVVLGLDANALVGTIAKSIATAIADAKIRFES
jgi:predicted dinucleotide-binding enzyme